jgi:hypothetical protein
VTPLWTDTDPDTEAEMVRLLGRASVAERFAIAEALTTSVVTWSRRALEKNRPTASRREILLEWAGLHYGHEIERELRDYLVASSDD